MARTRSSQGVYRDTRADGHRNDEGSRQTSPGTPWLIEPGHVGLVKYGDGSEWMHYPPMSEAASRLFIRAMFEAESGQCYKDLEREVIEEAKVWRKDRLAAKNAARRERMKVRFAPRLNDRRSNNRYNLRPLPVGSMGCERAERGPDDQLTNEEESQQCVKASGAVKRGISRRERGKIVS